MVEPAGVVVPRPAATVVLLRPGPDGLETLLTHRPATMAFAAGAHVFPGGRVDPADADPALLRRTTTDAEAAAVAMGGDLSPTAALAAHVAAIRELFEEAGVLLADRPATTTDDQVARARSALLRGEVTFPEVADALDLRLRTDDLVPLSHWVTPVGLPRRFDTRFFVAALPAGISPSFEGDEVAAHVWLRPTDGLEAMADGRMVLWLPTSSTLQQLARATSLDQIRERLSPRPLGPVSTDVKAEGVVRITMPAGGGVAGQPVHAYLVGGHRRVLVDPGDPTGPALERAIEMATADGGGLEGIVLTHADPDHAGGAEALSERLGIPVFVGPGGGRALPYAPTELADGALIPGMDLALRAVHTPGPRPDHLALVIGDGGFVLAGDLDGERGARMLPEPADPRWAASLERLAAFAPGAVRLGGHPAASDAI